MGNARLTYYVTEQRLTGRVAGRFIQMLAQSGAGAIGPEDVQGASAVATSRSIPAGRYFVRTPLAWQVGQAVPLQPIKSPGSSGQADGFNGYRIHGQRLLGCDRAILAVHHAEFVTLLAGLRADDGGTLEVCERMPGNYPERWAATDETDGPVGGDPSIDAGH